MFIFHVYDSSIFHRWLWKARAEAEAKMLEDEETRRKELLRMEKTKEDLELERKVQQLKLKCRTVLLCSRIGTVWPWWVCERWRVSFYAFLKNVFSITWKRIVNQRSKILTVFLLIGTRGGRAAAQRRRIPEGIGSAEDAGAGAASTPARTASGTGEAGQKRWGDYQKSADQVKYKLSMWGLTSFLFGCVKNCIRPLLLEGFFVKSSKSESSWNKCKKSWKDCSKRNSRGAETWRKPVSNRRRSWKKSSGSSSNWRWNGWNETLNIRYR